jgi:hypothetical protein
LIEMANALIAFVDRDRGDLGRAGAMHVARAMANIESLTRGYYKVHAKSRST